MNVETASDAQRLAASFGQLPEPMVKPVFVVLSGLPGTGKSHVCRELTKRLPLVALESDALRKVLFPAPTYAAQESSRLFRAIHQLLELLLKKGTSLVLDATNLSEAFRERLYNIAERLNARLIIVSVEAPPEVVRERLKARTAGKKPDHSDAGWTVYEKMRTESDRIRRNHFVIDTSRDITPVLNKIIREAKR